LVDSLLPPTAFSKRLRLLPSLAIVSCSTFGGFLESLGTNGVLVGTTGIAMLKGSVVDALGTLFGVVHTKGLVVVATGIDVVSIRVVDTKGNALVTRITESGMLATVLDTEGGIIGAAFIGLGSNLGVAAESRRLGGNRSAISTGLGKVETVRAIVGDAQGRVLVATLVGTTGAQNVVDAGCTGGSDLVVGRLLVVGSNAKGKLVVVATQIVAIAGVVVDTDGTFVTGFVDIHRLLLAIHTNGSGFVAVGRHGASFVDTELALVAIETRLDIVVVGIGANRVGAVTTTVHSATGLVVGTKGDGGGGGIDGWFRSGQCSGVGSGFPCGRWRGIAHALDTRLAQQELVAVLITAVGLFVCATAIHFAPTIVLAKDALGSVVSDTDVVEELVDA